MARINTDDLLKNNKYKSGGVITENSFNSSPASIKVDPGLSDRYDYAVTENIELLNDRKDTTEKLYEIFQKSPFKKKYVTTDGKTIKIPKNEIPDVFYYCRDELKKVKPLSTYEFMIAICEFFEFDYKHIFNNVMSTKMKADLFDNLYKLGDINPNISNEEQLF